MLDWTLRSKLMTSLVLSATLLLLATSAAQYWWQRRQSLADLDTSLNAAATRLSANLVTPVWELQNDELLQILKNEAALSDIRAIAVRDEGGALLGGVVVRNGAPEQLSSTDALPTGESRIFEVHRGGKVIAVGAILYGDDRRSARLRDMLLFILGQTVLLDAVLMFVVALVLGTVVFKPLERLTTAAAGMAAGDLRQEIAVSGRDEIATLAQSFRSMAGGLRSMVSGLREAAGKLQAEGQDIVGVVSRQASMNTQQAAAISETTTTVSEIAQTAKAATEHADRVIEVAQRSEDLSLQGKDKVEQVVASMVELGEQVKATAAAMNQLAQRAQQIGDVVSTVKELAEQSNLLALNAAIEASRAGEHGRGFSVVALEMRSLAEQSKAAAGRVRSMLEEVQKWTQEAAQATTRGEKQAQSSVRLARAAGESIEGLAQVIRESSLAAKQIAANTRQQAVGVDQIVRAIEEVSSAMSETVVGTQQIERGTGTLSELSSGLLEAVNRYQV